MALSQPPTLANLQLTLSQPAVRTDPPSIHIIVKNTHRVTPLTILTWSSPLDQLLLPLGLMTITPPGSSAPLDIPTIQVKRSIPPGEDSLVTLEPGSEVSRTVELKEPFMTAEELRGDGNGKGKAQLKGTWTAVWPGLRKEELVRSEKLDILGYGAEHGVLMGDYKSNVLEVDLSWL